MSIEVNNKIRVKRYGNYALLLTQQKLVNDKKKKKKKKKKTVNRDTRYLRAVVLILHTPLFGMENKENKDFLYWHANRLFLPV